MGGQTPNARKSPYILDKAKKDVPTGKKGLALIDIEWTLMIDTNVSVISRTAEVVSPLHVLPSQNIGLALQSRKSLGNIRAKYGEAIER